MPTGKPRTTITIAPTQLAAIQAAKRQYEEDWNMRLTLGDFLTLFATGYLTARDLIVQEFVTLQAEKVKKGDAVKLLTPPVPTPPMRQPLRAPRST